LPMHYCVTSTSTTSLSTLSLHDALPIYPGQVTTRDVDATSACADGQRQATVRVGCTRPAVGHTGARVFGVAPDVFDALIFDQGDIIVDPVVVGAEDQRLVTDLALQPFLGQGGALVRPVVFVAEQGDVLIAAHRSRAGG